MTVRHANTVRRLGSKPSLEVFVALCFGVGSKKIANRLQPSGRENEDSELHAHTNSQ